MRPMRIREVVVALGLTMASCGDGSDGRAGDPARPGADGEDQQPLDVEPLDLTSSFEDAAEEFDVPVQLLQSVSYTETRWQMVDSELEFEGRPATFGLMALRSDRLEDAAELAGVDPDEAASEVGANIRAAAAWMSAQADMLGVEDRADLGSWAEIVADYSGIEDEVGRSSYVYQGVYTTLREGLWVESASGEFRGEMEPVDAWPSFLVPPPSPVVAPGPDYPASLWRPSANYSNRPGGAIGDPGMVIIHSCEGSYAGCWSWLKNPASGVSAHYVIKEDGEEITQLVRESKKAWHISASYDCDRNSDVECWRNGYSSNHFTVGIEHAGYAGQASWDPTLIDESAKLVCNITEDQDIPRDSYHIVSHGQLQPWNRVDPGPNWPWDDYLDLIDAHCGEAAPPPPPPPGGGGDPPPPDDPPPPPGEDPPPPGGEPPDSIIIDSNNDNNDEALGFIAKSSNWISSSGSAERYETGYWYAGASPVSDPVTFWFHSPDGGEYTVDAWWTAGTNRSATAPFVIYGEGEGVSVVKVNMQQDGGQWNELGTWTFAPGWNKVQLSRWTSGGGVVIADALRVRSP